jgi:Spy/CpxP family protein refolding chaperone
LRFYIDSGGKNQDDDKKPNKSEEAMKKIMIGLTMFSLLCLFAMPVANACGGHHHGKGHKKGHGHVLGLCEGKIKKLGLNAEQEKEWAALKEKYNKQLKPLHETMMTKKAEMMKLWEVDKPKRQAIMDKYSQIDKLKSQLRGIKVDMKLNFFKILNAEQKKKVREIWATRHDHKAHGADKKSAPCDCGHKPDCDCPCCKK